MAAGLEGQRIALNENDIYGTILIKEIDLLRKTKAIRWLKCRSCRNRPFSKMAAENSNTLE